MINTLKHKNAICFIFLNMMIIGFTESMRGIFVPQFKQTFNITDSNIGIMFSIALLGYIISTYLGGILCSKFGQKKVFILSTVLIVISYFFTAFSPNFIFLLLSIFLTNIGSGLQNISVNSVSPILFITYQTLLINLTHFFYGFGVTISQRFSGLMISKGFTFKDLYILNGIILALSLVWMFWIKFPQVKTEKLNLSIFDALKNKTAILIIFAQGFYVFSEIGFLNWFVNFAQSSYNFTTYEASFYSALFFFIFTLGRLSGGFIVHRFGIKKSMLFYLSSALLLFWSGYLLKSTFTILMSLAGFFFSIMFPTTITIIGRVFKENTSYTMGIILTFVSTVNMTLNYTIGKLNDKLGAYTAFALIPISLTLSLIFYILTFKNVKKETLL